MLATTLLLALQAPDPPKRAFDHDLFGVSLDRAGDLDGDGIDDLWVGDPSVPI